MNNISIAKEKTPNNKYIGTITICNEKSLNVLTFEIIKEILATLRTWEKDSEIVCVVLKGSGGKAFCAGGDIKQILSLSTDKNSSPNNIDYFINEYSLDYLIHTYNKPIIVLADGIVMGGGMGLTCGASHRVVTDKTLMAMPEITIGLFPDVGATYFLNRSPDNTGMFLGLTGARFDGNDAIYTNLADYMVKSFNLEMIIKELASNSNWSNISGENTKIIDGILSKNDIFNKDNSKIAQQANEINDLIDLESSQKTFDNIATYNKKSDLIKKAAKICLEGSPLSFEVIFKQISGGKNLNLEDVFRRELDMAVNMTRHYEFNEGVSALVIRKDKSPNWTHSKLEEVSINDLSQIFNSPWGKEDHPFKSLGEAG